MSEYFDISGSWLLEAGTWYTCGCQMP